MKPYILIVEDEPAIATMLQYNLEKEGFEVNLAEDGEQGLIFIDERKPDLVLLDWMLPIYSGIEVCRKLRAKEETRHIPVILLTARGEESDKIEGLDSGADDYVVKPFSPKELILRIHAILRRTRPIFEDKKQEYSGITIDLNKHTACYGKNSINIGPTEFRLLSYFMERPGQVFSRQQLLDNVWGQDAFLEARTVDVHIRRLRKALDAAKTNLGQYIKTIRSTGYMLDSD